MSGSRDGAVVRALAFHQCGLGSIPGLDVIYGLCLLLVLVPVVEVFLRVLRFFPPLNNPAFSIRSGMLESLNMHDRPLLKIIIDLILIDLNWTGYALQS